MTAPGPDGATPIGRLRDAARLIRSEHKVCRCGQDDCPESDATFYVAVAELLADEADQLEDDLARHFGGEHKPQFDTAEAWAERNYRSPLAVADAYLGATRN